MELIFLVVLAAMIRSAQIPFSSWLPAAMAAPTPVSVLVHSSILVTAGVYLLMNLRTTFEIIISKTDKNVYLKDVEIYLSTILKEILKENGVRREN